MLRRSLLATFVTLIAGALAPSIPVAAGPDPAEFMNNLAYQLQVVARNTSEEERQAGFRELFDDDFDVPSLGRFVLGRLSQIMTAQEQQEFLGLFENYVVMTYSDRLPTQSGWGNRLERVQPKDLAINGRGDQSRLATNQARRPVQGQRHYHRWSQHGGERALRSRRCGSA